MPKNDFAKYNEEIQKLKQEIAGEIVIAENPGNALKKWQNIFEITQISLARAMKLTGSTISDYENGRRNNPGINFVKRFVDTLIDLDIKRKAYIIKKLINLPLDQTFETKEFKKGIKIKHTSGLKEMQQINSKNPGELVFGITYLDEQSIADLESNDLQKTFGKTNKRIFYIANMRNALLLHMFLKNLKSVTNLYPAILILDTDLAAEEINKYVDVNIPIFTTTKTKDELKVIVKDL